MKNFTINSNIHKEMKKVQKKKQGDSKMLNFFLENGKIWMTDGWIAILVAKGIDYPDCYINFKSLVPFLIGSKEHIRIDLMEDSATAFIINKDHDILHQQNLRLEFMKEDEPRVMTNLSDSSTCVSAKQISVNSNYLLRIQKALDLPYLTIAFQGEDKPCLIMGETHALAFMMPVKTKIYGNL